MTLSRTENLGINKIHTTIIPDARFTISLPFGGVQPTVLKTVSSVVEEGPCPWPLELPACSLGHPARLKTGRALLHFKIMAFQKMVLPPQMSNLTHKVQKRLSWHRKRSRRRKNQDRLTFMLVLANRATIPFYNNHLQSMIAGGIGGTTGDLLMHSLDTVKTRQQGDPHVPPKYTTMASSYSTIFRQEGIRRGLYAGWLPAMLGSVPGTIIFFGTYEYSKRHMIDSGMTPQLAYLTSGECPRPDIKTINV